MTSAGLTRRLRVLICDDYEVARAGLQALLDSVPDLVVVGHAASSSRAVELFRERVPQVALVSQNLSGDSRWLVRVLSRNGVGVIVMGRPESGPGVIDAFRVGARCYVTPGVVPAQLIAAIRAAGRGEITVDPQAVAPLLLPHSVLADL
jgi:NarL family two-component system response regulator LiaR